MVYVHFEKKLDRMFGKIKVLVKHRCAVAVVMAMSLFFFSCGTGKPGDRNVGYDSMIVEFESYSESSGGRVTVYETLWIDQKNKREASLVRQEAATGQIKETLVFTEGCWMYNIDLSSKTGAKTNVEEANKMALAFGEVAKVSEAGLPEFVKKNGGKMIGNEMFLGKNCVVFEMFGFTQWMYKGVVLKTMAGSVVVKKATKIEENAEVPSSLFTVPEGIIVTEAASISGMSYK
jgi:hypothetical protein